jgi:hypothetical protein
VGRRRDIPSSPDRQAIATSFKAGGELRRVNPTTCNGVGARAIAADCSMSLATLARARFSCAYAASPRMTFFALETSFSLKRALTHQNCNSC